MSGTTSIASPSGTMSGGTGMIWFISVSSVLCFSSALSKQSKKPVANTSV